MMSGNHKATCSRHAHTQTTLNGKTGAVMEDSGTGEAETERGEDSDDDAEGSSDEPPVPKKEERERIAPPGVSLAQIQKLQDAIETRALLGLKQPLSKALLCEEYHLDNGVEVGCTGYGVVAIVDEHKCGECEKMNSKRELVLCILHGARYADGEAVDPQLAFELTYT